MMLTERRLKRQESEGNHVGIEKYRLLLALFRSLETSLY